jgi:hypothetical protein
MARWPLHRGGGEQWLLRGVQRLLQVGGAGRKLKRFCVHHYSPLITAIRHKGYSPPYRLSTLEHKMW